MAVRKKRIDENLRDIHAEQHRKCCPASARRHRVANSDIELHWQTNISKMLTTTFLIRNPK